MDENPPTGEQYKVAIRSRFKFTLYIQYNIARYVCIPQAKYPDPSFGTVHVNKFNVRLNARFGALLWCWGSVSSSSTVIAQILPKNCAGESPRVIVKWYLALVASLIGLRYVTH